MLIAVFSVLRTFICTMDADSSESEVQSSRLGTPPRKARKRHYEQKYSKLWEKDKEFASWLQESTKGEEYFYCKSCRCDLKCVGGRFILNKHANSLKHVACVKGDLFGGFMLSLI